MAENEQDTTQSQVGSSAAGAGSQDQSRRQGQESQPASSGQTGQADSGSPQIDTSVLQEDDDKNYDSASVNLANPGTNVPDKPQSDQSTAQSASSVGYQPQTPPPPENATDNEQPSKLQATPPPSGSDESNNSVPYQSPRNWRPVLIIFGLVLILALIGGGLWWFFASQGEEETTIEEPAPQPEPEVQPPQVRINSKTTENSTPDVTGTVDNTEADVRVIINGREYRANVNRDGTWQTTVTDELDPGTYTIYVTALLDGEEFDERLVDGLTVETAEPEPEPEPESEPEETPETGPEELTNTGPSDSSRPPSQR